LPEDWPNEQFDLIVISEIGYYLDPEDLKKLIVQAEQSLTADGQLLACHWRPPIDGCPLNARQVHDMLHEHLHLPRLVLHQEADFLLELWSREPRSVAALEGLR
jgi:SAM-dependent methyltransferase